MSGNIKFYKFLYGPESIFLEPVKVVGVEEFTVREILKESGVYVPKKREI
jgi:hypothetical protein